MKVRELIDALQMFDSERDVVLHCDGEYGFPDIASVSITPLQPIGDDTNTPVVIWPSCPD